MQHMHWHSYDHRAVVPPHSAVHIALENEVTGRPKLFVAEYMQLQALAVEESAEGEAKQRLKGH